MTPLTPFSTPKLLVLELWGVGDLALAMPFLKAASETHEVTLLAKPHASVLLERFAPEVRLIPIVAPWTAFEGKYDLRRWPIKNLSRLISQLKNENFDIACSPRRDPRDHALAWLIGARTVVGFEAVGSALFLDRTIPAKAVEHRYEHWRKLAEDLRINLPARIGSNSFRNAKKIVLHSGAAQPVREWPLERYALLATHARRADFEVTVICDHQQRNAWRQLGEDALIPSSLDELIELFSAADVFIGNDSGPGHLAALMNLPTFTIFGPQLPELFAPIHTQSEWIQGGDCDFKPCFDSCRYSEPHCLLAVSPEKALTAFESFLKTTTDSPVEFESATVSLPDSLPEEAASEIDKIHIDQQTVLGTPLVRTDYEELTEACIKKAQEQSTHVVDFTNTHIVTLRQTNPAFRETTSETDWFVPDGMPLIWLLNLKEPGLNDRVYGPRFMTHFFEHAGDRCSHFLLGASEDCLSRLTENLQKLNPHTEIVGSHHGYFGEDDEEIIINEINQSRAEMIWIGLGTPKQQEWIHRNRHRIKRGGILAVGFAFDVNAGTKQDAPMWMQRRGLTWLFRMASEPRRLIKRYLVHNTVFLWTLMIETINGRLFKDS